MTGNNTGSQGCSIRSCSSDGIIRDCFSTVSWSTEIDFCDCVVFPGWVGPDCDEVSPELIHSRVWYLCTAIGMICLAFLLVGDICRLFYINNSKEGQIHVRVPMTLFVLAFATLCNYVCQFIYSAILSKSAFDPKATKAFDNFSVIKVANATTAFVFLNITLGSSAIAVLQITLSWINIIDNIQGFTAFNQGKWKTAVTLYRKFAQAATVISFGLAIVFAATLNELAIRVTMIVILSFVTGFLIIGRIRFVSVLRSFGPDSRSTEEFKRPIYLVRKTSCYLLLAIFLGMAAVVVQLTFAGIGNTDLPPGDFSFTELMENLSFFSGYCFYLVYHWYVHKLANTFSERKWMIQEKAQEKRAAKLSTPFIESEGKDNQEHFVKEITL